MRIRCVLREFVSMPTLQERLERETPDEPVITARSELIILTLLRGSPHVRELYQLDERMIDNRLEGLKTGQLLGEHEGRSIGFEEGHSTGYREGTSSGRRLGQLIEARASVRSVLACRGLAPGQEDEARIDACGELWMLRRWLGRSVTAASAAEALA
jgi:hypothetical protein